MKEKLKRALITAKNNVMDNKAAYTFALIAMGAIGLQVRSQKLMNSFLDEKGLADEYYAIDEVELAEIG